MRWVATSKMTDEFMQQPNIVPPPVADPLAMEQMRREFERIYTGPQQDWTHHIGSSARWTSEFNPGIRDQASFPKAKPGSFDPTEFSQFVQSKATGVNGQMASGSVNDQSIRNGYQNGYRRPMGMGFGGMGYNGMGMGMGMGSMAHQSHASNPQDSLQSKGKARIVEVDDKDWEAQFAQLDTSGLPQQDSSALDNEAERAMEAELQNLDRSVPSNSSILQQERDAINSRLPDFESTWRKISAELPHTHRTFTDNGFSLDDNLNPWHDFSSNEKLNLPPSEPESGNYMFETDNIFDGVADPFGEGVRIMDEGGNLSLAALAFEAAVRKDPQHVDAWTRLGAAQAQNEKETPAIRALTHANNLDPGNLEAMMGLAVSHTNEGYEIQAYRTLKRWICTKYPQLAPSTDDPLFSEAEEVGFTNRTLLHERVTDLFIRAAQLSPDPANMDPDVQVGLGVLFYSADAYDKAVDCFGAALASSEQGSTTSIKANQRPLLWNRLGATLANSGRSEEAIEAYERALQLNSNFVRARYNLGVSCINIGCLTEAAQHLLGALDMHKMVEREGREKARELVDGGVGADEARLDAMIDHNQSTNLLETLKRVFRQMERDDLVDKVGPGMDPASFRGEFDF